MKQIPNLFTLGNLFFGCLAVIFILQNGISVMHGPEGVQYVDMPEKIWLASLCIGIAAVVDFLDGLVARAFKATSAMGKQLDSLADLVSFGVAPGMICYQFLRMSFMKEPDGVDVSIAWLMPALLIPCAAAWRLARFNISQSQEYSFTGVPVPAVGLLFASLPLIYWNSGNDTIIGLLTNKWVLYLLIILVSFCMVSRMPIMALKFKDFTLKNNFPKYLLVGFALVSAMVLGWLSVPVIFLLYIVLSLSFKNQTR
jgi:CDP-diacylglycerol--serine O-phosphatidyltransferase